MKRCLHCGARFTAASWQCPECQLAPAVVDGRPSFAPELAGAITGYDAALFAEHGGDRAERSFWTQARSALIGWALGRFAPGCRSFLEVGCGTGGVLAYLEQAFPHLELVGAEALAAGLSAAERRPLVRARLLQLDARRLPFDGEFD